MGVGGRSPRLAGLSNLGKWPESLSLSALTCQMGLMKAPVPAHAAFIIDREVLQTLAVIYTFIHSLPSPMVLEILYSCVQCLLCARQLTKNFSGQKGVLSPKSCLLEFVVYNRDKVGTRNCARGLECADPSCESLEEGELTSSWEIKEDLMQEVTTSSALKGG